MTTSLTTPAAQAFMKEIQGSKGKNEDTKRSLEALYGSTFPALNTTVTDDLWAAWHEDLWQRSLRGKEDALHFSARNRLFAEGRQWVASHGNGRNGQWKEPPAPKSQVQAVYDMIGPALDYRLQVITENRPGWRFTPTNQDADRQRKAEAWQRFVEYQWHQQKMQSVLREAEFYAQRDGVSFMLTYWDPEAGPKDEEGALGDIGSKVYRIEQVGVSPNATANKRPIWWVVREAVPTMEAVAAYGVEVLEADESGGYSDRTSRYYTSVTNDDAQAPLYAGADTVDRFLTFLEPNQFYPQGMVCVTVGKKLVYGPVPLPVNQAPMVRVTDGSSSPLFFPPPIMNRWVPVQQRINTLVSKGLESIRLNVGGRFITKPGAVTQETMVGGQFSAIEVRSWGNIDEAIKPVTGFSIGQDLKEFLDREIQQFENLSGWNDVARGSFSSEQSGRAILAIREQLERTMAPAVNAASESMSEWAWLCIEWARWGYTVPRSIGVVGENRPDLAREITQNDLDGVMDVYVDPETMTVMPRALRMYILEDALQKSVIDVREYRQRMPFGFVQDFSTPDDVQEAKGKRVAEAIRQGVPPEPVIWQDDEGIQQTILERDILLAANVDPAVWQAANQRWTELANQSQMKMAPPQMQGQSQPSGPSGPPQGGQEGLPVPPEQQPMLGTSPSTASAPANVLTGQADQNMAASLFESTSPQ